MFQLLLLKVNPWLWPKLLKFNVKIHKRFDWKILFTKIWKTWELAEGVRKKGTKNVPKNLIVCIFTDSKFKSIIPKLPFWHLNKQLLAPPFIVSKLGVHNGAEKINKSSSNFHEIFTNCKNIVFAWKFKCDLKTNLALMWITPERKISFRYTFSRTLIENCSEKTWQILKNWHFMLPF